MALALDDPFTFMGLINLCSGTFSAAVGLGAALSGKAPADAGESNPWKYVLGGTLCALVGVGNWYHLGIATWVTLFFIATSIYDGWFGPGSKDWRFYTLTAYVLAQGALVAWSAQIQSLFTLP